jgi:DNA-binding XRE family transcriptional regulator
MTPAQYRKHREQLGLTQVGLAAVLGVTRETVNKREAGTQRIIEEMSIALRALPRAKEKRARGPQNSQRSRSLPKP